jgi:hypothetical protein
MKHDLDDETIYIYIYIYISKGSISWGIMASKISTEVGGSRDMIKILRTG